MAEDADLCASCRKGDHGLHVLEGKECGGGREDNGFCKCSYRNGLNEIYGH
jgi:hypothetical protein